MRLQTATAIVIGEETDASDVTAAVRFPGQTRRAAMSAVAVN
jgi:hypothetical protein